MPLPAEKRTTTVRNKARDMRELSIINTRNSKKYQDILETIQKSAENGHFSVIVSLNCPGSPEILHVLKEDGFILEFVKGLYLEEQLKIMWDRLDEDF